MPITPESDVEQRGWTVETAGSVQAQSGVTIPVTVDAQGPLKSAPGGLAQQEGFELRMQASFNPDRGHYLLRGLSLKALAGDEVTGTVLRGIAPLAVLRWILPRTFELNHSALTAAVVNFVAPELRDVRDPDGLEKIRSVDLKDVATIYSLASIVRYPPAKAVAEAFEFPSRTASNWIARARAANLI
ncbi:hypothetical protein [Microbacterium sp.]|uniref:hypothetical protein n=1 Tax=Microbacterium sp. TaxID=51671 RepID=UPI0035B3710C